MDQTVRMYVETAKICRVAILTECAWRDVTEAIWEHSADKV